MISLIQLKNKIEHIGDQFEKYSALTNSDRDRTVSEIAYLITLLGENFFITDSGDHRQFNETLDRVGNLIGDNYSQQELDRQYLALDYVTTMAHRVSGESIDDRLVWAKRQKKYDEKRDATSGDYY